MGNEGSKIRGNILKNIFSPYKKQGMFYVA